MTIKFDKRVPGLDWHATALVTGKWTLKGRYHSIFSPSIQSGQPAYSINIGALTHLTDISHNGTDGLAVQISHGLQ